MNRGQPKEPRGTSMTGGLWDQTQHGSIWLVVTLQPSAQLTIHPPIRQTVGSHSTARKGMIATDPQITGNANTALSADMRVFQPPNHAEHMDTSPAAPVDVAG